MTRYTDVEGGVVAWARGLPDLTGRGYPLAAGMHLNVIRSPSEGAAAYVEGLSRNTDDATDDARLSFVVLAANRGTAEWAARALAEALAGMESAPATVTTSRGDRVRLLGVADLAGPTFAGEYTGEVVYRVDGTVRAQPG